MIKKQFWLKLFKGLEIGQHMNKDESAALGANFHAANLSHSFRVRSINFYDGYNFAVRVVIKNLE